ncbi:MAG: hypothetical protein AB1689_11460 [Thermodesulfobacteriota bacterium]
MRATTTVRPVRAWILLTLALCACSDAPDGASGPGAPAQPACDGESFDGTFAGIQKVLFEAHGCTEQICHGSAAQGGLELSPEVAYRNLFDVRAVGS